MTKDITHVFTKDGITTGILGAAHSIPSSQLIAHIKAPGFNWHTRFNNGILQILRECTHVALRIPSETVVSVLNQWNDKSIGWKLVKSLGTYGLSLVQRPDWVKLMTMELTLDNTGKNPVYQSMKLSYHGSWSRLLGARPRLTLSMQGWLKQHLGVEPSDSLLKNILNQLTDGTHLLADFFELDESPSAETFVEWYTNITNGPMCGVSVQGSCMHYDASYFGRTDGQHPVEAYSHPSGTIGIARIRDDEGRTRCRCLLNNVHKTFTRIYSSGSEDTMTRLNLGFERLLKDAGYSPDFNKGLKGCTLSLIEINCGEQLLAPYIDGAYRAVDSQGNIGHHSDTDIYFSDAEGTIDNKGWDTEEVMEVDDDDDEL